MDTDVALGVVKVTELADGRMSMLFESITDAGRFARFAQRLGGSPSGVRQYGRRLIVVPRADGS